MNTTILDTTTIGKPGATKPHRQPFAAIPHELIGDPNLKALDLRVLAVLLGYARADSDCWPSVGSIAGKVHRKRRSVQYALARLRAGGIIAVEADETRRTHRRFLLLARQDTASRQPSERGAVFDRGGVQKSAPPGVQKNAPNKESLVVEKQGEINSLATTGFQPSSNDQRNKHAATPPKPEKCKLAPAKASLDVLPPAETKIVAPETKIVTDSVDGIPLATLEEYARDPRPLVRDMALRKLASVGVKPLTDTRATHATWTQGLPRATAKPSNPQPGALMPAPDAGNRETLDAIRQLGTGQPIESVLYKLCREWKRTDRRDMQRAYASVLNQVKAGTLAPAAIEYGYRMANGRKMRNPGAAFKKAVDRYRCGGANA